jgi:hypothetical protein
MDELKALLMKFAEEAEVATFIEKAKNLSAEDVKLLKEALTSLSKVENMPLEAKKAVVSLANVLKPVDNSKKPLDERNVKFLEDIQKAMEEKHGLLLKKVDEIIESFNKKGVKMPAKGDMMMHGDNEVKVVSVDAEAGTCVIDDGSGKEKTVKASALSEGKKKPSKKPADEGDPEAAKKKSEEEAKAKAEAEKKAADEKAAAEKKLEDEKLQKRQAGDPFRAALYGKRK